MDEVLRLPEAINEFLNTKMVIMSVESDRFLERYLSFGLRPTSLSNYEKLIRYMIEKEIVLENHEGFGNFLHVVFDSVIDRWWKFVDTVQRSIQGFDKYYFPDMERRRKFKEWFLAEVKKVRNVRSFMQLIEESERRFGRVFGTVGFLIEFLRVLYDDLARWTSVEGVVDKSKSPILHLFDVSGLSIYVDFQVLACYLKDFDVIRGGFLQSFMKRKDDLDTDTLNKEPTVFAYYNYFREFGFELKHYITDYHYWVDEPDVIMSYLGFEQEVWSEEIMARMYRLRNVVNSRDNGGAVEPMVNLYVGNIYASPLVRQVWYFKHPVQVSPFGTKEGWSQISDKGYLSYLGERGFYYPLFVEMEIVKKFFRKKAPSPALGFFYWSYLRLPFDYFSKDGDYRTKKIHGWHLFYPYLLLNEIFSSTLRKKVKRICEEEGFFEKYEKFLGRYVRSVDDYEAFRRVPRKFQNFSAAMVLILLNFYLSKKRSLRDEERRELRERIDVLLRKTACLTREGKAFVDALIFLLLRGKIGTELNRNLKEVKIEEELLKDGEKEFGKRFFNFRRGFYRAFSFVNEFPEVFYTLVRRSSSVGCFFAGAFLWHVLYEKGIEGLSTEGVRKIIEALIDNPRTPSMVFAWLLPQSIMGYSELGYAVKKLIENGLLDDYRAHILDSHGRSLVCRIRKFLIGFEEDFLERDLQKEAYNFEAIAREGDEAREEALRKFEEGLRKWGLRFFRDVALRYFADELFLKRAFDLIESGRIKVSEEERREFYKIMAVCSRAGDLQLKLLKKGFDVRCCLARNPHLVPIVFYNLFMEEGQKVSKEYFWLVLNYYAFNPLSSPRTSVLCTKVSDNLVNLAEIIDLAGRGMGKGGSGFMGGSGAFEFLRKIGEFLRTGRVSEGVRQSEAGAGVNVGAGDVETGGGGYDSQLRDQSGNWVGDFSVSCKEVFDFSESKKLDDVRYDFSFLLENRECLEALVKFCVVNREESDMSEWNNVVRAFYVYVASVLRKGLIDAYERGDQERLKWLRDLAKEFYTYQKNYAFFDLSRKLGMYFMDERLVGKGFKEEFRKEVMAMGEVFYEVLRGYLPEDIGGGLDTSYGDFLKLGKKKIFPDLPPKENLYFEKKVKPDYKIRDCFWKFDFLDPVMDMLDFNEKKLFPFRLYEVDDPFQRRLAIWELLLSFKRFNEKQLKGLEEWHENEVRFWDGDVFFSKEEGRRVEIVVSDEVKNKKITHEEVKKAVAKMIDYIYHKCGGNCDDEERRVVFQLLDEIESERRVRDLIDTVYGHWDIVNDYLKMLKIAVENDYLLKDQVEKDRVLNSLYRFRENPVIKEFFCKLIDLSKDLKEYDVKGYRFAMFKASEAFRDGVFGEAKNSPWLGLSYLVPDNIDKAFSSESKALRTGTFQPSVLGGECKFYDYVEATAVGEYMDVGGNSLQRSWLELSNPELRALVNVMSYDLEEDYWGVEKSLWKNKPLKELVRIGKEIYDSIDPDKRSLFADVDKKQEMKRRFGDAIDGLEGYFREGRVLPEESAEGAYLRISGLVNVSKHKEKFEEKREERCEERKQLEGERFEEERLGKGDVERKTEEEADQNQRKLERVRTGKVGGRKDRTSVH